MTVIHWRAISNIRDVLPQLWPVALRRWASSAPPDRAWPPQPRSHAPAADLKRCQMLLVIGMLMMFSYDGALIMLMSFWDFLMMFKYHLMILEEDLMIMRIVDDSWEWFDESKMDVHLTKNGIAANNRGWLRLHHRWCVWELMQQSGHLSRRNC